MTALGQYKLFMIFFAYGLLVGIICGLMQLTNTMVKGKVIRFVLDLTITLGAGALFWVLTTHYNSGEIRIFLVIAFVLGIMLERISVGKIFAKWYKLLYNVVKTWLTKFKNSKLGKRLFR